MNGQFDVLHTVIECNFKICATFNKLLLGATWQHDGKVLVDNLYVEVLSIGLAHYIEHLVAEQVASFEVVFGEFSPVDLLPHDWVQLEQQRRCSSNRIPE